MSKIKYEKALEGENKGLEHFLRKSAAVKNLIDNYIANNMNSNSCDYCTKHYALRSKLVHEKHCLVRLAMEATLDVMKMSTFCLRAQDIECETWKEIDNNEVLEIIMAERIPYDVMEGAYYESIWEDYYYRRLEYLWPDGVWRKEDPCDLTVARRSKEDPCDYNPNDH